MADAAKGTTFSWNSDLCAHVIGIDGPSMTVDAIETTDLDDTWKTFIANIPDGGEISLELEFEPDDTDHAALFTDFAAGTSRAWAIVFSDAGTTTFSGNGFVTSYGPGAQANDKLTCTVGIKVSGEVSRA